MSSSKNLELEKTAFLNKSNSAFIEEMYMKFVSKDPSLPESWKEYFDEIGDELDVIINEINGPSWGPAKKISISKTQNQKQSKKAKTSFFSSFDLFSFFYRYNVLFLPHVQSFLQHTQNFFL